MFYTFRSGVPDGPSRPARQQPGPGPGPSRSESLASSRPRSGTFKACDRCRLYRIKCGDKPCAACRANNAKCVWRDIGETAAASPSSLGSPTRSRSRSPSRTSSPPLARPIAANAPASDFTSVSNDSNLADEPSAGVGSSPSAWTAPVPPPTASSSPDAYVRDFRLLLKSVSPALASDSACANNPFPPLPQDAGLSRDIAAHVAPLTPLNKDQRTYFARLFWTSCGSFFPLMSEVEFQALFAADWGSLFSNNPMAAAMVDGMTALGTQCGYASGTGGRILGFDAAARADPNLIRQRSIEYFARCRDRLRVEGTRVTIDAIRCYVLLGLYHLQANQLESAYYIVGLGVRRAHMIKLHQTPPAQLDSHEAVGRILTWWMLYWLDIHCSMQLDRPPAVQQSTVTCPLPPNPRDNPLANATSGQAMWKGIHPSAFTYFSSKLTQAMAEALEGAPIAIFQDASVSRLEEASQKLLNSMKSLEAWIASLPAQLMNPREEDSSTLVALELGTPDWLQRQRTILELRYSNACMLLQRPFVLWSQVPSMSGVAEEHLPRTKYHADGAVRYASNMISLLYGIYSKSDLLDGLPMALQSLWNAAMTLSAHIYIAGDLGPQAAELAHSLSTALVVMESLSHANPEAVRVYSIISLLASRLQEATGLRIHHGERTPVELDMSYLFSPADFSSLGPVGGDAATLPGLHPPLDTTQSFLDASFVMPSFDNTLYPGFETLFDDLGGEAHSGSLSKSVSSQGMHGSSAGAAS